MKFLLNNVYYKVYINTSYLITLINKKWLQANKLKLPIYIIAKPLFIRGIKTGKVYS